MPKGEDGEEKEEGGKTREQRIQRPQYIAVVEFILRNGDGFFHNIELRERFGRPVYCFRSVLGPAAAVVNDCVGFKLHINKKGFPAASGPLWRLYGNDQPGVLQNFGECVGTVIETLPDGGALICSEEANSKYGRNDVTCDKVFVDRGQLVAADVVAFQVQQAPDGTLEAMLPVWKMTNDLMAEAFEAEQERLGKGKNSKGFEGKGFDKGGKGPPKGMMDGAEEDIAAIPWPPPETQLGNGIGMQQHLVPMDGGKGPPAGPSLALLPGQKQPQQMLTCPIPKGLGGVLAAEDFPQYVGIVESVTGSGDAQLRCADIEKKYGCPVSVDAALLQSAQAVEDDCLAFKLGEGPMGPIAIGPLWKLIGQIPSASHGQLTPFGEYLGSVTWKREDGSGTVFSTDAARSFGGNRIMDNTGQMRGADVIIRAQAFRSCRLLVGDIISFNVHRESAYSEPLAMEPMFRLMKQQQTVQMAPVAPAPMMNAPPMVHAPMMTGPPMGDLGMGTSLMPQPSMPQGPPPPVFQTQPPPPPVGVVVPPPNAAAAPPQGGRPGWINNLAQKRRRVADAID